MTLSEVEKLSFWNPLLDILQGTVLKTHTHIHIHISKSILPQFSSIIALSLFFSLWYQKIVFQDLSFCHDIHSNKCTFSFLITSSGFPPLLSVWRKLLEYSWVQCYTCRNKHESTLIDLCFYLEIITDSQKMQTVQRSPVCSLPSSAKDNNLLTVIQYQNKESDIGTIHRPYSDFTMHSCVCVVPCNFIIWLYLCTYHNHHEMEEF